MPVIPEKLEELSHISKVVCVTSNLLQLRKNISEIGNFNEAWE